MNIIISMMVKSLGGLDGYKTYIGIGLAALAAGLRYWDANHPALDMIAAIVTGLGVGDKMGKERATNGKK
jgi:hypothetical protein